MGQVENMRKMGFTEEEIQEMLADDKAIDRGEEMPWDMTKEEHKQAMKFANVTEKKTKPKTSEEKKSRKKDDPLKEGLITKLFDFLQNLKDFQIENAEILNKERKVLFRIADDWYSFTLTKHRTKPDK